MLLVFQLLFILFALFSIASIWKRKKEHVFGIRGAIFWSLLWLAVIIVVSWPDVASMFASRLGIGRGSDLVIYIALGLLFFIMFHLHIKLERINHDMTKIVRRKAIEE